MKAFGSTYILRFALILIMSCMVGGCRISYKLNGAAIDYTVYKTIYVSNFPIRAALVYPPLQQTFENELLDYITRNTRLRTVDTNNADLQLEGEITGYNLSPQAVTENAYASRTRLTIQVKITYTDNRNDAKDVSQTFSAYRDFDSSEMLTDVQDQLCSEISKELVDLIFNATLGDLVKKLPTAMDEALSHYLHALADPEVPVSISDVEHLLKEYPFFTLPAITLMRREGASLPPDMRRKLMMALAVNAPDPASLAMMTDPRSEVWLNFYPPEQKEEVTTDNAIDTFLATYGHSSPEEDALLEKLIFNPTADYSVLLAREEEESLPPEPEPTDDSQDALINAFILKNKAPQPAPAEEPEPVAEVLPPEDHPVAVKDTADDSSLSESLAKIYIKRRRYDKAFEIIHNLSLKNPKKSIYFADQLRFLQKLMINSRYNS